MIESAAMYSHIGFPVRPPGTIIVDTQCLRYPAFFQFDLAAVSEQTKVRASPVKPNPSPDRQTARPSGSGHFSEQLRCLVPALAPSRWMRLLFAALTVPLFRRVSLTRGL